LQKTAILGTSHILRKVLQSEAWMKPEWWGAPLVQGKEHWERPVLRDNNNNNNSTNNNNNNNNNVFCSSSGA
jgi:hypothetical protein